MTITLFYMLPYFIDGEIKKTNKNTKNRKNRTRSCWKKHLLKISFRVSARPTICQLQRGLGIVNLCI